MFLSIITVTYNAGQWLERTIKSVACQTSTDYEYLIIDGVSNDNTLAIAKHYEPLFQGRMHILSEKDRGLYDAMNKGIKKAEGDYVWFVNAGDEIHSADTIERIKDIAHNADIIYGNALNTNADGEITGNYHKLPPSELTTDSYLRGLAVCHQAFIVKRYIAPEYDLHYRIAADYDWEIRAVKQAKDIRFVNLPLCRFLLNGLSQQNFLRSWSERFSIMRLHFGLLRTLKAHTKIAGKYLIDKTKRT